MLSLHLDLEPWSGEGFTNHSSSWRSEAYVRGDDPNRRATSVTRRPPAPPHRPIPLLGHPQLHQHPGPFRCPQTKRKTPPTTAQQPDEPDEPESVKHLQERLSPRNRNRVPQLERTYRNPMVKHEPEPHRRDADSMGTAAGTERDPGSNRGVANMRLTRLRREPPRGIEPRTYALRGESDACAASSRRPTVS